MGGKLSKHQTVMVAAVLIFFGGLYGYWTWLLNPTLNDIKTREVQIGELKDKIEKAERQARRLPALRADKEKLEKELESLEKQLPRDQDRPNIIRVLTRESQQENLEFERLAPRPVESRNFFQVIPFDIQFNGTLQAFIRFLSSLGQQDRIFQAQNIKLTPKGGGESGLINLTISFIIQTYSYTGAN